MAKIKKLYKKTGKDTEELIYPVTITQAIKDGETGQNLHDYMNDVKPKFKFNATQTDGQLVEVGSIQLSQDGGKTWNDISPEFINNLRIQKYVATASALPSGQPVGTIYAVGPTYDAADTSQTNPIYTLYVYDGNQWVNNGKFTSIAAGVVQETGDSETQVMSQKATTEKLTELASQSNDISERQDIIYNDIYLGEELSYTKDDSDIVYSAFVNADGNLTDNSSYKTYSIPVSNPTKIKVTTYLGSKSTHAIVCGDKDGNVLLAVQKIAGQTVYESSVPSNVTKVFVTCLADSVDSCVVEIYSISSSGGLIDKVNANNLSISNNTKSIEELNGVIYGASIEELSYTKDDSDIVYSAFVNADGNLTDNSSYKTYSIPVSNPTKIKVTTYLGSKSTHAIVCGDKDGNVLLAVQKIAGQTVYESSVPSNVTKVFVTCLADSVDSCVVEIYSTRTNEGLVDKVGDDKNIASKELLGKVWRENARMNLRPIKILGLGNSWLKNCTNELGYILTDLGIKYEIHRLYKSSCSLQEYASNIISKTKIFEHSVCKNGEWVDMGLVSLEDAMSLCDWDIVTLQQVSGYAGIEESWQPYFNNLVNWIKDYNDIVPLIYIHSTWAYPNGSTHSNFGLYDNDSETMYNAILSTVNSISQSTGVTNIIPTTPMIQQARLIDGLKVDIDDGTHLYAFGGQYAAACLWAETLLRLFINNDVVNKSINDCNYNDGVSETIATQIKNLASTIVANIKSYYP